MRGTVLGLLALAAMTVGVLIPVATVGDDPGGAAGGTAGGTGSTITRYNAVFAVSRHGDMEVTETVIVDLAAGDTGGLVRTWDALDPREPRARRLPQDLRVTRDGVRAPFRLSSRQAGRLRVARVGEPRARLGPGLHTYVLSYEVEDVLLPGPGGRSRLAWDLVPRGWAQPISSALLTVRLPERAVGGRCALVGEARAGRGRTPSRCRVTGQGTGTLVVSARDLPPDTGVSVAAKVDLPTPHRDSLAPWPALLVPALGSSWWLLALVLVGIGWTSSAGVRLARQTRGPRSRHPLQHTPPTGLGPAEAAYLLTGGVDRDALLAGLMRAAERGCVRLTRRDGGWELADRDPDGWDDAGPVARAAADALGVRRGAGDAALQRALAAADEAAGRWARQEGLVTRAGLVSLGGVAVVGAAALYGLLLVLLRDTMSVVALVPGAFAALGLPVLRPGLRRMRTARGRAVWSRVDGFRRALAAPTEVARFDFAGREELYTAYLPYAVAFGCAEEWAGKYRDETGGEPPSPPYLPEVGRA